MSFVVVVFVAAAAAAAAGCAGAVMGCGPSSIIVCYVWHRPFKTPGWMPRYTGPDLFTPAGGPWPHFPHRIPALNMGVFCSAVRTSVSTDCRGEITGAGPTGLVISHAATGHLHFRGPMQQSSQVTCTSEVQCNSLLRPKLGLAEYSAAPPSPTNHDTNTRATLTPTTAERTHPHTHSSRQLRKAQGSPEKMPGAPRALGDAPADT